MMVFTASVYRHHAASITGFDILYSICEVIVISGFELGFIIVDKADCFVVAYDFDVVATGEAGDFFEIEVWGCYGEFIIDAVLEPVAFPAIIPAFD